MLNKLQNDYNFYMKEVERISKEMQTAKRTNFFAGDHYKMYDADGNRMIPPKTIGEIVYLRPELSWATIESIEGEELKIKATFNTWREKNKSFALFTIENEELALLQAESKYYLSQLDKTIENLKRFKNEYELLKSYRAKLFDELKRPEKITKRIDEIDKALEVYEGDEYINDCARLLEKI